MDWENVLTCFVKNTDVAETSVHNISAGKVFPLDYFSLNSSQSVNFFPLQEGLRTLCVAYRHLSPEQYQEVCHLLSRAKLALQDRDRQLAEAYDLIEKDLILLGATAVEDRWRIFLNRKMLCRKVSVAQQHRQLEFGLLQIPKYNSRIKCSFSTSNTHQVLLCVLLL